MGEETLPLANLGVQEGAISAEALFSADSRWFEGHFPENPILPGVAIITAAIETIRRGAGVSRVIGLKRIRFRKMIGPNEKLFVKARPAKEREGEFYFEIKTAQEIVCHGSISFETEDGNG